MSETLLILANQATAAKRRVFFDIRSNVDHFSPVTSGVAGGQPQVSSNGAAWTDTGIGVLVAIGNGRYYAELTQTLVLTAGTIIQTRYAQADCDEAVGTSVQVTGFDPALAFAAAGDAMTLTSGERTSIGTALLDLTNGIETGMTLRGALRLLAAACAGKLSGAASSTMIFRNAVADTKPRITATVSSDGRTAISTDLT